MGRRVQESKAPAVPALNASPRALKRRRRLRPCLFRHKEVCLSHQQRRLDSFRPNDFVQDRRNQGADAPVPAPRQRRRRRAHQSLSMSALISRAPRPHSPGMHALWIFSTLQGAQLGLGNLKSWITDVGVVFEILERVFG